MSATQTRLFPHQLIAGVEALLRLDADDERRLQQWLDGSEPGLSPDAEGLGEAAQLLIVLDWARWTSDAPLSVFIDRVCRQIRALEDGELAPPDDDWIGFRMRLARLLCTVRVSGRPGEDAEIEHPLDRVFGVFRDDPLWDRLMQHIHAQRRADRERCGEE